MHHYKRYNCSINNCFCTEFITLNKCKIEKKTFENRSYNFHASILDYFDICHNKTAEQCPSIDYEKCQLKCILHYYIYIIVIGNNSNRTEIKNKDEDDLEEYLKTYYILDTITVYISEDNNLYLTNELDGKMFIFSC